MYKTLDRITFLAAVAIAIFAAAMISIASHASDRLVEREIERFDAAFGEEGPQFAVLVALND